MPFRLASPMTDQTNPVSADRKIVLLTEGFSEPITAKTATSVIRYGRFPTIAILDSHEAGKTAQQLFDIGGDIPVVAKLSEAAGANTLMIGIAPPGGKIPDSWRPIILEAIHSGMDVVSGLHDFLSANEEFVAAAKKAGVNLVDVRKNNEHDVANRLNWRDQCLRIHTVGQDCSIGKMLVSVELTRALQARGHDAKFVATGQTGIMIEGDGCPIDCVVADFVSGAIEKQILAHQHHDFLFIEGQGSLSHPRYSAVTLGLLHGCLPHAMILCYEAGRTAVNGMEYIPLKSLPELRTIYENTASIMMPARVIGIAMNSRLLSGAAAEAERQRVREEMGLPVCDVIRHGPDELVDAVLQLHAERSKTS
ncbi:MAG: DUF1611 domain-containing protein [Planctomycetales bacterium]|nr:DUF1611 domain-containing protein [Planctomycetales bacterium]